VSSSSQSWDASPLLSCGMATKGYAATAATKAHYGQDQAAIARSAAHSSNVPRRTLV
jgi:hypothetical protein